MASESSPLKTTATPIDVVVNPQMASSSLPLATPETAAPTITTTTTAAEENQLLCEKKVEMDNLNNNKMNAKPTVVRKCDSNLSNIEFDDHSFQLGVVLYDCHSTDRSFRAIASPISGCRIHSFVILNGTNHHKNNNDNNNDDNDNFDEQIIDKDDEHNVAVDNVEALGRQWIQLTMGRPATSSPSSNDSNNDNNNNNNSDNKNNDVIRVVHGTRGFATVLNDPAIDGIVVIVPTNKLSTYVIQALKAGKHVLIMDPISTPLHEFTEQLNVCRPLHRFVQFYTMFVQEHRVRTFLNCINGLANFGRIESIDAKLFLNYRDIHKVGMMTVSNEDQEGQGCLRWLGRYCVLVAILLLIPDGAVPVSAQVLQNICYDDAREGHLGSSSARCKVNFSQNRTLTFHVEYSDVPTRQLLQVRSHDRYAVITDFAIPHADSVASYRIYDNFAAPGPKPSSTSTTTTTTTSSSSSSSSSSTRTSFLDDVVRAEALDVPSGPPQDVVMWRRFRDLCWLIEARGWDSPESWPALELTNASLQTKQIFIALDKSLQNGFVQVPIDADNCYFATPET